MRPRSLAAVLAFLLCFAHSAGAQDEHAADASLIGDARIFIFGNRYLKAESIIRMCGLDRDPLMSTAEVKQRLQTRSLFSTVEVLREGLTTSIFVREKTTWFIVPYFSKDSASSVYGVAFGQASVLGRSANIVGRYQVGTGDHQASLLARDDNLFEGPFAIGASLDYEDSLHRIYRGREVAHRTLNQYHGGSFQVGYGFDNHTTLTLNNYVERHRFEELDGKFYSGLQWSHKLILDYDHFYVNEGLSDGASIRTYYESSDAYSTFHFDKLGLFVEAGLYRKGDFNWILRESLEWSATLPRYQLFELGGGRLRSFPSQQFRDRYYGEVQNDILLTSVNVWKLRLRPLVYADWAFIQSQGHTGLGAGFQVYVKDVAIPAVQFFFGYGFNPNGFGASAAIGPQF